MFQPVHIVAKEVADGRKSLPEQFFSSPRARSWASGSPAGRPMPHTCDRRWSCVTDSGRVAGLTGGGGPCESWFRVLLFCCRGGSTACVLASGGTRRCCPPADQARG